MSEQFPLDSDAFSGASRITAQQRSEGRDKAPLFELLNLLSIDAESVGVMAASVDLQLAEASAIAAYNRTLVTNSGAARTLTLPDFATAPEGWNITAMAFDGGSNTFTIARDTGGTINGVAANVTLVTDGAWVKIMKIAGQSAWIALFGDGSQYVPVPAADVSIADGGGLITATDVEGALQEVATDIVALELVRLRYFETTILFGAITGGGASISIPIASFPTNAIFFGAVARATTQFTGEPDLAFQVGFFGGDVNAIIETTDLHQTGNNTPISVVQGVVKGGQFYADASGAGLAALFTATALADVTAGSLTIRFYYIPAFPS